MELYELSATAISEALEAGELSSEDLVRALHERSDKVNSKIVGWVHEFRERSLIDAKAADARRAEGDALSAMDGVPLSVKESVETEGVASTLGFESWKKRIAERDAVSVRVARGAGGVVLGKTNVPQSLIGPFETTNKIWGTSKNPWSAAHATGGSSGGEAAAIAAGLAPLGIGTDIGGSIRLPAALCGICGLKPGPDRWSNSGSKTTMVGQEVVRAQIGPMARTVDDLTLMMRAMDTPKHSQFDPRCAPAPLGDPAEIDVSELRVGFYEDDGFFAVSKSIKRGLARARKALEDAGVTVIDYKPTNVEDVIFTYFAAMSADGGSALLRAVGNDPIVDPLKSLRRMATLPGPARNALARATKLMGEPRVSKLLRHIGEKDVDSLWRYAGRRTDLIASELAAWDDDRLDALLCPITVTPALKHGESHDFTMAFVHAARYNLLHLPAGVVPTGRVAEDETWRPDVSDRLDRKAARIDKESVGLPVACQVVSRPWREDVALAVMKVIEDGVSEEDDYPSTPIDPRS